MVKITEVKSPPLTDPIWWELPTRHAPPAVKKPPPDRQTPVNQDQGSADADEGSKVDSGETEDDKPTE